MRSFQLILMHVSLVGAFALTVCWTAIARRRGIALVATQILDKWRRIGNLGRALLFTFVTAMILYGSTKTNLTNGVNGGTTNQTDGADGGTTNPPMTMAWAPLLGAGQIQDEIPQPTEGRVPANATLAQNWWRRGGWEDWRTVDFDADWVFPHGTNHLSKATVMSQGALRTRVSDTEDVHIVSPFSRETQVELDSSYDASTFTLSVEVLSSNETYVSTLQTGVSTNDLRGLSLSMPDTVFANDDDDDGDGETDTGPDTEGEDDIACGTVTVPIAESGVLSIVGIEGFAGDVYERTSTGVATVLAGASWRKEAANPDRGKSLYFDAHSASAGYRRARVCLRWRPDSGRIRDLTHRFTVVAPTVEPICMATTNVVENEVARTLTVNPCGVGIGRDAYFRVDVKPNTFPDSKIVWTADGDGSVSFPNGNTGRNVMVHGLVAGEVQLHVAIGDSTAGAPSFPLRVVTNRVVKLSAWILTDQDGVPVRSVESVRELVKKSEDIYSQVGVTFDLANRVVVTNMNGRVRVSRGGEVPGTISLTNLVNIAHGTAGLELYCVDAFYNVTNGHSVLTRVAGVNRPEGLAIAKSADASTLAHEIGHTFGLADIYENGLNPQGSVEYVRYDNMMFDWNGGCEGVGEGGARYYARGLMLQTVIQRLLMNGEPTVGNPGSDITSGFVRGLLCNSLHGSDVWGVANIGFFFPSARVPIHE